jgi:hypothetical protein
MADYDANDPNQQQGQQQPRQGQQQQQQQQAKVDQSSEISRQRTEHLGDKGSSSTAAGAPQQGDSPTTK